MVASLVWKGIRRISDESVVDVDLDVQLNPIWTERLHRYLGCGDSELDMRTVYPESYVASQNRTRGVCPIDVENVVHVDSDACALGNDLEYIPCVLNQEARGQSDVVLVDCVLLLASHSIDELADAQETTVDSKSSPIEIRGIDEAEDYRSFKFASN